MKRKRVFTSLLLAAAVAFVGGCSDRVDGKATSGRIVPPDQQAVTATASEPVCQAELGQASPVHAVGNIYLAGQPQEADMPALAERGIKTVVSLRKPDELDWDEAAAVRAAGMEYVAVPFDGPEELTDGVFDRVRQELRQRGDEPLVLHCGRANRVGAVWMVHRVLDEGVGIDAALEEAKAVGLKTPEYIEKAQAYIRQAQSETEDDPSASKP